MLYQKHGIPPLGYSTCSTKSTDTHGWNAKRPTIPQIKLGHPERLIMESKTKGKVISQFEAPLTEDKYVSKRSQAVGEAQKKD